MSQQLELTFQTTSPINTDRLSGQNKRLWDFLAAGNTIHCFHPAMKELGIGYLNSRTSDLRKMLREQGKDIFKRYIKVRDANGEEVTVREYSLSPFSN
jgi:hypothetical protein